MKNESKVWVVGCVGAVLAVGTMGCSQSGSSKTATTSSSKGESSKMTNAASASATSSAAVGTAAAKPADTSAAKAAAPVAAIEYQEIPAGNRLVVVGTKEGAEKARQHGKPGSYVAEIGYGPDGQTVYFENKPDGIEKALKAEYAKRHPAAK